MKMTFARTAINIGNVHKKFLVVALMLIILLICFIYTFRVSSVYQQDQEVNLILLFKKYVNLK